MEASAYLERIQVTDTLNDDPIDIHVVIDLESGMYKGLRLILHVQIPPTFPLALPRFRVLTPIIHPFVIPLWRNSDFKSRNQQRKYPGGTIAFLPTSEGNFRSQEIAVMIEVLVIDILSDPKLNTNNDESINYMKYIARCRREAVIMRRATKWTKYSVRMKYKATLMHRMMTTSKWQPEGHFLCPRSFKVEVRTLLLVRLRVSGLGKMPMELLFEIINVLFNQYLADMRRLLADIDKDVSPASTSLSVSSVVNAQRQAFQSQSSHVQPATTKVEDKRCIVG